MRTEEIKDKRRWEKFIVKYSPQSFFQSFGWGEVISPEYDVKRIFFYGRNGPLAAASVRLIKAKRGKFLHVRHGPVFSEISPDLLSDVTQHLSRIAEENSCSFIRVSPLIGNSPENNSIFQKSGFRDSPIHAMDGELCWVLDLSAPEQLLKNMRKTTRYLIRKASDLGVKIELGTPGKDMDDFLTLYSLTAKRHGFVEHRGIQREFEYFSGKDEIVMLKGTYEGKLLSAALIVFYNDQAIYHHSASVEQKIPVNYLLQWEAINEAIRRKKKIYNFWGIAPEGKENHPWRGLSLFKQGFGGRKVEYMHAKDFPLTRRYNLIYLLDTIRRIRKGY